MKHRIEWVDLFKALTIVCVVLGHATGDYNAYIYQFHMAAFFFISGYTADLDKRSMAETLWQKLCTMLLPLATVFLILWGVLAVLTVLLPALSWNRPFDGISLGYILLQFVSKGSIYIAWLGAAWFLIVLFGSFAMQKLLRNLSGNRAGFLYAACSALCFGLGYLMAGTQQFRYLDLIFIGQFYLFCGVVARQAAVFDRFAANGRANLLWLALTVGGLYYFGNVYPNTVDYPSRAFGFIVTNYLAAINGTFFIYLFSYYLSKAPAPIKQGLFWVGENTLAILFFHFIFFKLGFLCLYFAGVAPLAYLQNFIPTGDIGQRYAFFFTTLSIVCSIALWKLLTRGYRLRVLLGMERSVYTNWYQWIIAYPPISALASATQSVADSAAGALAEGKRWLLRHRDYGLYLVALVLILCAPLLRQGIICNDELQRRFLRWQGFSTLLSQGIEMELAQGRPMRILAALQNALSYVGTNIYLFRSFQLLLILSNIALFSYFVFCLFRNKRFAVLTGICLLLFLPITFEHTAPNAFVGLLAMPMNFLLCSLIAFIHSVEKRSRLSLLLSLALFFTAMMGYEFIVTFVLLFPVLWFAKTDAAQRNLAQMAKSCAPPLLLALLFVSLTFGLQRFFAVGYDGAKLGFVSLESSFQIIWTLFKSSIPGYYLFNAKYAYLYSVYSDSSLPISSDFIRQVAAGQLHWSDISVFLRQMGQGLVQFVISNGLSLRIVLLWLLLPPLLLPLLRARVAGGGEAAISRNAALVGVAYMAIPSLPNSLVKLYQGNVSERFFTGLPVSYFLYFSATFGVAWAVWGIARKFGNKYCIGALIVLLCLYGSLIQSMNETFANEQARNYQRLVRMEQLFDTAAVQSMKNQSVYAPDLYATKNLLAVHEGFWTQFAKHKGLNLQVISGKQQAAEPFAIYEQPENVFVLSGGDEVVVLAAKPLRGALPVKIAPDAYAVAAFAANSVDGKFFRYSFVRQAEGDKPVLVPLELGGKRPFAMLYQGVGSTLAAAQILAGYHKDGWLEKRCVFKIRTQSAGKVVLAGYYPTPPTGKEMVTVSINGQRIKEFLLDRQNFQIEVAAPPHETVTVEINSSFSIAPANGDIRQLSFVLSAAEGK